MEPQSISKFSHPVDDYRLVMVPPAPIRQRLQLVKAKLQERYGLEAYQLGSNQILLASFHQYAHNEQKIVHRLKNGLAGLAPVQIQTHQLSYLPGQGIFIPLPVNGPMGAILGEIKRHQWLMRTPMQSVVVCHTPQIGLAHHLSSKQAEIIWSRLQHRRFTELFEVAEVLLMRRLNGHQHWHTLEKLPLLNHPVWAQQGLLFA
jgi:hypothetical protein